MSQLPGISTLDGNRVSRASSIVNSVMFDVSVGAPTDYTLPFNVSDPSRITIRYLQATVATSLTVPLEFIPSRLLTASLKVVQNAAARAEDVLVSYNSALNAVTVTPGTAFAVGQLQVFLYDRAVAREAILVDPGTTGPAPLPFRIVDFAKTWLGNNLQYEQNPGLFINGPSLQSANCWHAYGYETAVSGRAQVRILSETMFQRETIALASNGFYLVEFV